MKEICLDDFFRIPLRIAGLTLWDHGLRTLTLAFSPPRQEDNGNLRCRPGDLQVVQQHVSATHLTLFPLGRISSLVHSGTPW